MPEKSNDVLKYFSSTASKSLLAIKKRKLSRHDGDFVQNNEISVPSTWSRIPAFDNTNNLVTTFEAQKDISYYIGKQVRSIIIYIL